MQQSRCRQYNPPGWETAARMYAPCGGNRRSIKFQAECTDCRPAYAPIILPANSGMNEAIDPIIRESADPCHGRRFCPPAKVEPINVHLKMSPVPGTKPDDSYDKCGLQPRRRKSKSLAEDYCAQCPNTCPLPRCPPGIKVERTRPIIPRTRLQESFFKMPSTSVYKRDYVERQITKTPSYAPERKVAETVGDFEQLSLTKVDYVPHRICPYQKPPWSFAKVREESNMKMYGVSSYKADYVPKEGKPAPSAKPIRIPGHNPAVVEDRTVYQVDYVPHCLPCKEKAETEHNIVACYPFDGLTIYKRDYIPKQGRPAQSVIDKNKYYARDLLPMDGTSTYKAAYEPFYFDDIQCIPAQLYDQMYPPPDKCAEVTCGTHPEAQRLLEGPPQPEEPYCQTPMEMRCSERSVPCVPPYVLKKEWNPYEDKTVIRVEHNVGRECQNQPLEYICPAKPCKPF